MYPFEASLQVIPEPVLAVVACPYSEMLIVSYHKIAYGLAAPLAPLTHQPPGDSTVVIRILVVDDSELFRKMICRVLSAHEECEVVSEVSDASDAIEKAKTLQPDVVLLDIRMPKLNGLEAIPLIKNVAPHTEILMVTQHDNRYFVREAFAAGARGFLNKTDLANEIIAAVVTVSLKTRFLSTSLRTAESDASTKRRSA